MSRKTRYEAHRSPERHCGRGLGEKADSSIRQHRRRPDEGISREDDRESGSSTNEYADECEVDSRDEEQVDAE